jgi:hypothetical protein
MGKLVTLSLLTTMGLGAIVALAAPSQTAAPTSSTRPSTAMIIPTTVLTLAVDSCNGCQIFLVQSLKHASGRWTTWTSGARTIRHGDVKFTVPTRRTYGMSMYLQAPWQTGGNSAPVVAVRYRNTTVGQTVTNRIARHKSYATACWAGTSAPEVTIAMRVVGFPMRQVDGSPGVSARVWFTRMHAIRPLASAYHHSHRWLPAPRGFLSAQDYIACKA